ncbi:putative PHD type zinc finger protein with BAH domain-containing protein [Microbotryomycetes sp. JL201]|nr:putative PHD type zinc finger protein with BAH domain-containing protein [Microbotryomycetes sp. JL201]
MPRRAASSKSVSLTLDGKPVRVNDHILVAAPWSERDGEPFHVARIIELLPPPSSSTSGKDTPESRLRVAYYLRPRDISTRYFADFRLLFASMHTDVVSFSTVRSFATVMHKEHIKDLTGYRKRRNAFYFSQLYDRYLHRYFDVVPVHKVKSPPANIVEHLTGHFEFIVSETNYTAELLTAQLYCDVCEDWAAHADSVKCARCARVFHLGCVDPPMAQKPKSGYAWSCAPCSKAHADEVDAYAEAGHASLFVPAASQAEINIDSRKWRTTNGWPFRYYGMHTINSNVLDPLDSLYPKARTRLGPRFQAIVPDWDYEKDGQGSVVLSGRGRRSGTPASRGEKPPRKNKKVVPLKPEPERGEDSGLQIICQPLRATEAVMDEMVEQTRQMAIYKKAGVDAINRALMLLMDNRNDAGAALAQLATVTAPQLGHVIWSEADKRKMNTAVEMHGTDLQAVARFIPGKRVKDVVKRYYMFMGHSKQDDAPQQPEEKAAAKSHQRTHSGTVGISETQADNPGSDEDDENSVFDDSEVDASSLSCAICSARASALWYNYAMQYPPNTDDPKNVAVVKLMDGTIWTPAIDSREHSQELSDADVPSEPIVAPSRVEQEAHTLATPCAICLDSDPDIELAKCRQCTLTVHAPCYGIPEEVTSFERWLCDLCASEKKRELSTQASPLPTIGGNAPMTAMECLKPTDAQNFVHLICAMWHPELKFSEPTEFRFVEGVTDLPYRRVRSTCEICNERGGAFAFVCKLNDGAKRKRRTSVEDDGDESEELHIAEAELAPGLWCPEHDASMDNVVVDIGQRDPQTKEASQQPFSIYSNATKVPKPVDSWPLFRQGRRLDSLVFPALKALASPVKRRKRSRKSDAPGDAEQQPGHVADQSVQDETPPPPAPKSPKKKRKTEDAPKKQRKKPAVVTVRRSGRERKPVSWGADMFVTTLPDSDDEVMRGVEQEHSLDQLHDDMDGSEPASTVATGSEVADPNTLTRPRRNRRAPIAADALPSVQDRNQRQLTMSRAPAQTDESGNEAEATVSDERGGQTGSAENVDLDEEAALSASTPPPIIVPQTENASPLKDTVLPPLPLPKSPSLPSRPQIDPKSRISAPDVSTSRKPEGSGLVVKLMRPASHEAVSKKGFEFGPTAITGNDHALEYNDQFAHRTSVGTNGVSDRLQGAQRSHERLSK